MSFDVIVIGSGFGGAITGCRLAEAGYKVLILERGRRWDNTTYPRKPGDPWIWDQDRPEEKNGWVDFRMFPNMTIVQGAAVGGGSLIYANVSAEAPPSVFENRWPKEITYSELKPHYDAVGSFMNVQKIPVKQWTPRTHLMKEGADKTGLGDRFKLLDMAISFDPDLVLDPANPPSPSDSKKFINKQGVEQGYCVHLGNCDIGCDVYAKNTLDKNYLPWAEKHGAEVRALHIVSDIQPVSGGYRVHYDRLDLAGKQRIAGNETARIVIIAAGSLGSTELLLRCRDVNKSLPNISPHLGKNWSSNGDFLTPAFHRDRLVAPTVGPTISSAIDLLDRSQNDQSFWIEDGGFPNLVKDYLRTDPSTKSWRARVVIDSLRALATADPLRGVMPWFAQGYDAGDGVLSLRRRWWLFGPRRLHLSWDVTESKRVIDAIVQTHLKLAEATGGFPVVPPTWSLAQDLITPHPLGGCSLGNTAGDGVVDHKGEVFGYPNLYVADGAILPTALGVNPSRTIGALAERIAKIMKEEAR
jgi:cholesterol oxidase